MAQQLTLESDLKSRSHRVALPTPVSILRPPISPFQLMLTGNPGPLPSVHPA